MMVVGPGEVLVRARLKVTPAWTNVLVYYWRMYALTGRCLGLSDAWTNSDAIAKIVYSLNAPCG